MATKLSVQKINVDDIRNHDKTIWIRCTSPEQGRLLFTRYWKLHEEDDFWHDFDFGLCKEFYIRLSNYFTGSTGAWNPTLDGYHYKKHFWVEFDQVQIPEVAEKKPIAYKLIKLFPGCQRPIGNTIPYNIEASKWPEFWEPIYETEVKIGEYKAEVKGSHIQFGCQSFTTGDLMTVSKLLRPEVDAKIVIQGTTITPSLVADMLKKLTEQK